MIEIKIAEHQIEELFKENELNFSGEGKELLTDESIAIKISLQNIRFDTIESMLKNAKSYIIEKYGLGGV